MRRKLCSLAAWIMVALPLSSSQAQDDGSQWTIYVTNDNCPDYTWGLTEEQTRQSFADIVRAHLDEINRTDGEKPENQDRYNMAVIQEALCFVERYPERKGELIQRIREGRVFVSPYLCNLLWAFQSVEGAVRTFYPARRLEREWGISMDVAEHIEEPSLPWGMATILAGCGVKWLSVPFYKYDSTFDRLRNPPLFVLEGPDGSRVRVVMDSWASGKWSYAQGAALLRDTKVIANEWLPHYRSLGESYPIRAILASGTHGDISPRSGDQARGFAEAIITFNTSPGQHPKLVNAILPQFCSAVDKAEEGTPFLPTVRGCFGHSWDLWPVSLAQYVAQMRSGERHFLAAESLLAVAAFRQPGLHEATRADRERAEWCWAMLADHAWNGTDDKNKRHNADLRKKWSDELNRTADRVLQQAWAGLGTSDTNDEIALFNSLGFPRRDLVRAALAADEDVVAIGESEITSQAVEEDGKRYLYFVSPEVAGFGFRGVHLRRSSKPVAESGILRARQGELESPFYRLNLDPRTGGIGSLVHKANGRELVVAGKGRSLCQTVYFDGQEHTLEDVKSEVVAVGPVMARLRVTGIAEGIRVTIFVTVYAELDRVDFDVRVNKPVTTREERLCQIFPVLGDGAVLRIETMGAVIRPRPQPEGDLLPGADTRRFAVQGFLEASLPEGPGVTIAPIDAFVLRMDLDPVTFEALGNDQNYREVVQNQDGVTEFRFRYALRAHAGEYDGAEAFNWSRAVGTPLLTRRGRLSRELGTEQAISVDSKRAMATCLKPADRPDAGSCILRLWETAGHSGPVRIAVRGFGRAIRTDLLERDLDELPIRSGIVMLHLPAFGFGAVRLTPVFGPEGRALN